MMFTRKIKLDVVMKSGTVIRLHVTEYTVRHSGYGISAFSWYATERHGRIPVHFNLADIAAVVRHR